MAGKKVKEYVKIVIPAGKANPAPPIGTALGPRGINIMDFCNAFNVSTKSMDQGSPVPAVITIYTDRTFSFAVKTPPASYLLQKAAKLKKGSSETKKSPYIGEVTKDQVREIANTKLQDLNANDIDAAVKIISGTAESMGIRVK